LQGIVERNQVFGPIPAHHCYIFQFNVLDPTAALQVVAPRMVHQNPSHELRRNGKEVGAVSPPHPFVVDQPEVSFVDQSRRL
jgi:hypothetical protein